MRGAGHLLEVLDAARNTGVRILLENGGSFTTAIDLAEIMDRVDHPLLGASHTPAVTAKAAGEDPVNGVNVLGDRLWVAKVKDHDEDRCRPCRIGTGVVGCEAFARALASTDAWAVLEWDRALDLTGWRRPRTCCRRPPTSSRRGRRRRCARAGALA